MDWHVDVYGNGGFDAVICTASFDTREDAQAYAAVMGKDHATAIYHDE